MGVGREYALPPPRRGHVHMTSGAASNLGVSEGDTIRRVGVGTAWRRNRVA